MTKFVTEYNNVQEAKELYEMENKINSYGSKGKVAQTEGVTLGSETKEIKKYPITEKQYQISEIEETLQKTIKNDILNKVIIWLEEQCLRHLKED